MSADPSCVQLVIQQPQLSSSHHDTQLCPHHLVNHFAEGSIRRVAMADCKARKLVQGAKPPQEVVAVVDGLAAIANALKESTDALPAVKSIFGAVDWIVKHTEVSSVVTCLCLGLHRCQLYHSNKAEWRDLAIFVVELFYRIRDKLEGVGDRLGRESELQSHLQTLRRWVHRTLIYAPPTEISSGRCFPSRMG